MLKIRNISHLITTILIVVLASVVLASCSTSKSEPKSTSSEMVSEQSSSAVSSSSSTSQNGEIDNNESTSVISEQENEPAEANQDSKEALRDNLEERLGQTLFAANVNNDKTGNWRRLTVVTGEDITAYAKDYYDAYFEDDKEIHAICNLGTKTTARLTAGLGMLYITVFEYVDGEEHDAEKMFTGTLLADYMLNLETGEIEKL